MKKEIITKNEEKRNEILKFFKEAFCVDGEVRFATTKENKNIKREIYWIRLEDSQRGVFFIGKGEMIKKQR